MFAPATQETAWFPPSDVAVRTSGDPLALASVARQPVRALDPLIPVQRMPTAASRTAMPPNNETSTVRNRSAATLVDTTSSSVRAR